MFVKVGMNFWSQHKTLDNKAESHHDDNRPEDKRGKWRHPGMSVASFIERVYYIPYQRWPPLRVLVWTGLLPGWNQAPEECPAMRHFGVLCGEQRSLVALIRTPWHESLAWYPAAASYQCSRVLLLITGFYGL